MDNSLGGIIYVRVSSDTQVQNGNGLQSQETACREYAKQKGINIIKVFTDGGVSGKYISRKGLDDMIAYLKSENKNGKTKKISYVLVDDIDRLSRDTHGWRVIKHEIESTNTQILSQKIDINDSPNSRFQQNIIISFKQLERENNAERVKSRQRSRMLDGYWPLYPPQGYIHYEGQDGKKIPELVQPDASIIAEALELFAVGMFPTKEDLRKYLKEQGLTTRHTTSVTRSFVDRITKERVLLFYAGYIDYKPWNVNMVQAKHQAIIDKSLVYRILEKLNPKTLYKKYTYSEIDQKMPLRGVIYCESCGHAMTGGPSKNRYGNFYFYYSCRQKGCEAYGKSFALNKVHGEFETLLTSLKVKPKAIDLLKSVCEDFSSNKEVDLRKQNAHIHKDINDVEKTINQLEERILSTNDAKIIDLYERKLRENIDKKQLLEAKLEGRQINVGYDLNSLFSDTRNLLEDPCNVWQDSDIENKRLLVRVLFSDKISYGKISGIGTSEIPLVYRDFSLFGSSNSVDLEMMGIEPMSKRHIYGFLPQ